MAVSIVKADDYSPETVKKSLEEGFQLLGLDPLNPFKDLIKPGNNVFIKPNWVADKYRKSCNKDHCVYTTITHPEIIKQVTLFVDKALNGVGKITIGDNPSIDADFEGLLKNNDFEGLQNQCKTKLEVLDLRPMICTDLADYGDRDKMKEQQGDPLGIEEINLGRNSMLYGLDARLFRGVFKQRKETIKAHSGETQLYGLSRSIYNADVFISIPKLKTHHKTGVTLNLKGLVGTIGKKNYLVHWRNGFPLVGGDAYPDFKSWFIDRFKKVKKRGAWPGNDTIWRMVVDLYSCFLKKENQKRFTIIDGILGGEGNGPFCPDPMESKTIIIGDDFLEADCVATRFMGFFINQIPIFKHYLDNKFIEINKIKISSKDFNVENFFDNKIIYKQFNPSTRWQKLRMSNK